ncbi:hypothetical protein HAX54_030979, partial [Datura stramonium]|nr:hypothetical protein [Datura stramonium]
KQTVAGIWKTETVAGKIRSGRNLENKKQWLEKSDLAGIWNIETVAGLTAPIGRGMAGGGGADWVCSRRWGEPKCWYSVPGSEVALRKVMRNSLPICLIAAGLFWDFITQIFAPVLIRSPGTLLLPFPDRIMEASTVAQIVLRLSILPLPTGYLMAVLGRALPALSLRSCCLSHEGCSVQWPRVNLTARQLPKQDWSGVYSEKVLERAPLENGIVSSSPMPPRMKPEFVGMEEVSDLEALHSRLWVSIYIKKGSEELLSKYLQLRKLGSYLWKDWPVLERSAQDCKLIQRIALYDVIIIPCSESSFAASIFRNRMGSALPSHILSFSGLGLKRSKENLSLQVQLPEAEMLLDLIRQVECYYKSQCCEMLSVLSVSRRGSLLRDTKALKAYSANVMDYIEQLLMEASMASEEIFVILPSLDEVKDAVSMAKSWLSRSQPFLSRDSMALGSSPSLELETLKVKTGCICSVLHDTEWLLNVENMDDEILVET